ncbi:hypothetical protein [Halovivax sp.]|uniref:hypothetical protein n=1 Tax=Halovivax sp. TaxID=1935978 RepID=UPI0025BDB0E2|nr:hypothetical protein [Halovivax sp.]
MERVIEPIRTAGDSLYGVIAAILRERPTMEHVLLVLFIVTGVYMYRGAEEFSPEAATFPQLTAGATAILAALLLVRNYLHYVTVPALVALGAYVLYTGGTAMLDDVAGVARLLVGIALIVVAVTQRAEVTEFVESFVAEPMQVLGDKDVADATVEAEAEGDEDPGMVGDEEPGPDGAEEPELDDAEDPGADGDEQAGTDSGAMYVYEIDDPRGPAVTGALCVLYMVLTFTIGMLIATPVFVLGYALWARMWWPRAISITVVSFLVAYLFYWLITDDIAIGWYTDLEPWAPPAPTELLEISIRLVALVTDAGVPIG